MFENLNIKQNKSINWIEPTISIPFPEHIFQDVDTAMVEVYNEEKDTVTKHYNLYYQTVKRFNSQSILEIGVRNGYSMYMMLAANPKAFYRGIDINQQVHGGFVDAYKYAEILAKDNFPEADVNIFIHNTQKIRSIPRLFDLVHVDGDHTESGATNDLELVAPIADKLIIDDYEFCPPVAEAIEKFIDKYDSRYDLKPEYYKTWRGHVILDTSNFLYELK